MIDIYILNVYTRENDEEHGYPTTLGIYENHEEGLTNLRLVRNLFGQTDRRWFKLVQGEVDNA